MRIEGRMVSDVVDIDVDIADVFSAITEALDDEDDRNAFKCALSNLLYALQNITDEAIAQVDPATRQRIFNRLTEQAARWKPSAEEEGSVGK